jgi:predicted N-formylglutamate amidohydrolase
MIASIMNFPDRRPATLIVSCEHGGRDVPPGQAALFEGQEALLASHRGWDPGSLLFGSELAAALGAALFAATTTRLLVDLNRSIGHRQLHSELTRNLSSAEKQRLISDFYRPHRDAVEGEIGRRIVAGERVVHIASHSFTPVMNGVVRRADVACLYDPRRPGEAVLSAAWLKELALRSPQLRLRRNYPYQGRGDGLATLLRRRHAGTDYIGIELEVNQCFVEQGGPAWDELRRDLIDSLDAALAGSIDSGQA